MVAYLSYRSGQESANKLAIRLKTEISTRVTEKTTTYLQALDQVNKNNISDLRRSLWSFDDFSSQERQAWQQMQLNSLSPITIIGFGTPTGGHRAVELLKDGTFSIRAAPNGGGKYRTFTTNPDGSPDQVTETSVSFDSRQRPWFKAAVQSEKAAWTNVYPHIYTGELLVALAEPVYAPKNGNFLGVTYGIRSLEEISRFLRTIDIKTGTVFIMERDQTLVATSSMIQKPYQLLQNAKDQKLLKAIDSQNLQISGAAKYLRDRNGNLANIRQSEQFEFEINGDRQSVQVTPISDRNGLDWAIVVVIPESDFMADIQANKVWTILLCGITLLVATGLSIITTRWITKPILRISQASKAIASGEWKEPLAENNGIAEISILATSFNQMTKQVPLSFDRVEVALKESQEKYKVLFQTAPIGISMTDKNGCIVESNIITEGWFGKPKLLQEECEEREPTLHVISPDGSMMPVEEYACVRALRTKAPVYDVETGIVCADGILRWFNVSAAPISSEQHGVVLIHVDISDRKQVEIALKQSERTNRAILGAIPDLLLRVKRDGSCLDFIPPLIDQAGTFVPVTKHLSEVLPPDLLKLQLQRIAQALATGELQVWEHQIIKNDQICHEEIRVFPCGIDECLVIVRDVSARKQTELALIEAKANAEAATKAKGEFLASMSHEIRTPMNGVIGMTQILEMTELTTDQKEFVKTIKDSGQDLLTIINDILDFSKIESGMLEIEARDFDLEEVIRGVCKLLENQAIAKQIDLKYTIAPNIPKTVIGDLARLRQILLNLVGNAVKFTQNGHVSISVSGKGLEGKYELTFAIADTGIGIASDRLDLLFQAFTQADNSISREYGGTGLGLAISKRLVNLMGGTIWVESLGQIGGSPPIAWKPQPLTPSTPQGSTFYFTITLLINQTLNQPQTVLAKEFVVDKKFAEKFPLRILLVEDNQVNQMVAKLMLQRLGYQINAIANNGLEAVQAVQNDSYDLVLMDVQMPKMDGLTATKMIRTSLKSHVRIVAMTADAMPEDRQACLDAGMDDFISKPISIQSLMFIVSSTK
ncbi:hypothetical protein APA_4539 [Pseudanabaena sp. lw0831]|uniref:response regulator n=1 Tax=Pseudanabaena sp. lw0831 TaxID=1357935 RepID=UPI001915B003|nr:response regulator [Pseudanabaena sp. lw0831]GBO56209.1 hypothetical protein APA_4539 [Pseudanabaena sp. lw0831]